jgi:uncharacterized protein (DUF1800 family)
MDTRRKAAKLGIEGRMVGGIRMPQRTRVWLGALAAVVLSACSGGHSGSGPQGVSQPATPPTAAEAARFLTQASFGATDATVSAVRADGYSEWIAQQMAMPVSGSHVDFMTARRALAGAPNPSVNEWYGSFWQQAVTGPDQLRQRVKLALSEIFVVSVADPNVNELSAAAFYDMLGANTFGNFRTLLEQVSLHPAMGVYLTWIANQKADLTTGRHPDQNYARESMQLMTIGLYQLNIDGTQKLDGAGHPIATYTAADIAGLADVLTGYSWYSPAPTATTFLGGKRDASAALRSMIPYAQYHATTAKTFLGVTIPASAVSDPPGDLKIALDTLFNHPNVGPFVSKQLIQRLVTSNPSPAYVGRVATVFNNNGHGVRGDMGAVVQAILLDPDARTTSAALADPNYGKLREPIVRMANWMRAFNATSASGGWLLTSTAANTSLDEAPLTSSSVFNFYRPGYVPPGTKLGALGYAAPEFQIADEVSVAGYINTMQSAITSGVGTNRDITVPYTAEMALASDPSALAERMNLLLLNGQMSAPLKQRIADAVTGVAIPGGTSTQAQINAALLNRAKLANFMAMTSAEYLAQR